MNAERKGDRDRGTSRPLETIGNGKNKRQVLKVIEKEIERDRDNGKGE